MNSSHNTGGSSATAKTTSRHDENDDDCLDFYGSDEEDDDDKQQQQHSQETRGSSSASKTSPSQHSISSNNSQRSSNTSNSNSSANRRKTSIFSSSSPQSSKTTSSSSSPLYSSSFKSKVSSRGSRGSVDGSKSTISSSSIVIGSQQEPPSDLSQSQGNGDDDDDDRDSTVLSIATSKTLDDSKSKSSSSKTSKSSAVTRMSRSSQATTSSPRSGSRQGSNKNVRFEGNSQESWISSTRSFDPALSVRSESPTSSKSRVSGGDKNQTIHSSYFSSSQSSGSQPSSRHKTDDVSPALKSLFGPARTKSARAKLLQQEKERQQQQSVSGGDDKSLREMRTPSSSSRAASGSGRPPRPPSHGEAKAAAVAQRDTSANVVSRKRKSAALFLRPARQESMAIQHTTAPVNVLQRLHAAKRVGGFELLRDDVVDKCDTLSTCCESLTDITVALSTQKIITTVQKILTATIELTLLLADKQNRLQLHRDVRVMDQLLQSALPALSGALQQEEGLVEDLMVRDCGRCEEDAFTNGGDEADEHSAEESVPLVQAMFAKLYASSSKLLHFLTLDCTLSKYSASGANAARVRDLFLQSPTVLQAVVQIASLDPLTRKLRNEGRNGTFSSALQSPARKRRPVASGESQGSDFEGKDSQSQALMASPSVSTASSQSSIDPTVAGRMRIRQRKRQRLTSSEQGGADAADDELSFSSGSKPGQVLDRMALFEKANDLKEIALLVQSSLSPDEAIEDPSFADASIHDNFKCRALKALDESSFSGKLPLVALTRIILGKMEDADDTETCIDYDNDTGIGSNDEEDDNNPLLRTNRLIRESGILPLLATTLVDSLVVVVELADQQRGACPGCCCRLRDRIHSLVSLLDGASLLDEANRAELCREGFCEEFGGCLVVATFATLDKLLDGKLLLDCLYFGDVSHELLRLLTSLSHENRVAVNESDNFTVGRGSDQQESGTFVLARVLRFVAGRRRKNSIGGAVGLEIAERRDGEKKEKLCYDASIFCLNAMTNLVESKASRRLVAEATSNAEGERKEIFVSWLTCWIVEQTASFKDAVIESTFGSSPSKHADRHLEVDEEEKLMIAGNGFIFLACLMVQDKNTDKDVVFRLRELVLKELPGDTPAKKVLYIKNTLKAFCNFYHLKIGVLSIAVISPVKALMEQLDAIQWDDV